jgi:hypothetical protein
VVTEPVVLAVAQAQPHPLLLLLGLPEAVVAVDAGLIHTQPEQMAARLLFGRTALVR